MLISEVREKRKWRVYARGEERQWTPASLTKGQNVLANRIVSLLEHCQIFVL